MKRKMLLTVKGKEREWCFEVDADTQYLKEWRDDNLDIGIIENIIPEWVVDIGLMRVWCFVQDLINFNL